MPSPVPPRPQASKPEKFHRNLFERMRWGFPRSTHIVVENGFHETLPAAEVQALVIEFLQGTNVADRHVAFATPTFLSLQDAKRRERQTH